MEKNVYFIFIEKDVICLTKLLEVLANSLGELGVESGIYKLLDLLHILTILSKSDEDSILVLPLELEWGIGR